MKTQNLPAKLTQANQHGIGNFQELCIYFMKAGISAAAVR